MTKELAIIILKSLVEYYNDKNEDSYVGFDSEDNEAIDMAIKALEQTELEPSYNSIKPELDCISREAVEKITWEEPSYTDALNVLTEVREKVRALPSVTPKAESGEVSVLDKIRVEIENDWQFKKYPSSPFSCGLRRALEIIDKYRAESEEE